jgi:hypothetical protein
VHLATPRDMDKGFLPTPAKKHAPWGEVSTMLDPYTDITEPPTRGAAHGKIVDITTGMNTITGTLRVTSCPLGKKVNDRIP